MQVGQHQRGAQVGRLFRQHPLEMGDGVGRLPVGDRELRHRQAARHEPLVDLQGLGELPLRRFRVVFLRVQAAKQQMRRRILRVVLHRGLREGEGVVRTVLLEQCRDLRGGCVRAARVLRDRGVVLFERVLRFLFHVVDVAERDAARRVARVDLDRLGEGLVRGPQIALRDVGRPDDGVGGGGTRRQGDRHSGGLDAGDRHPPPVHLWSARPRDDTRAPSPSAWRSC